MKILFIGDIAGRQGRKAAKAFVEKVTTENSFDFIIANGENAAGGIGITPDTGNELLNSGIDCLTMGNHVWGKKESYDYIDRESRIIRPANYPLGAPGRGWGIFEVGNLKIGVLNLLGRTFMQCLDDPFMVGSSIINQIREETPIIITDIHAEATSEKGAFARYVDGRVTAVLGTHTHIQTSDEFIFENGTAFITDVGMCGPVDSILGMRKDEVINHFLTAMPARFEAAMDTNVIVGAVVIETDDVTGNAVSIERISERFTVSQ